LLVLLCDFYEDHTVATLGWEMRIRPGFLSFFSKSLTLSGSWCFGGKQLHQGAWRFFTVLLAAANPGARDWTWSPNASRPARLCLRPSGSLYRMEMTRAIGAELSQFCRATTPWRCFYRY